MLGAYLNTHISPNSVSYISFLGLGYPILLVCNLAFIILWTFFRWKLIAISLFTILIGWNHFRHFYAITFSQYDLEQPVKVMSFNVRIFDLYNLQGRMDNRDDILSFLLEEDADIICFQEFYHQEGSSEFSTKDTIISLLGTTYYHERYTHKMRGNRYFGVATFTKHPIINKGEIPFDNDPNNYCIYSDVVVKSDTFRVFNAHLGSIRLQSDDYEFFGDETGHEYPEQGKTGRRILGRLKIAFEKRAIQAEKVAEEIASSPYPVIFCADLNDTPVSYCYRQFNELLDDAHVESGNGIGQTYIGKVPSNRIDYIFYDPRFKSANFTTHQVNLSDHKPISCELQLREVESEQLLITTN